MNYRTSELARLFSPAELVQAREWIADCYWPDADETDIDQLSAEEVANGIRRHFQGGIVGFKMACIETSTTNQHGFTHSFFAS